MKKQLKEDLSIFVDVDEFGELAIIDGVILPCQIIQHTADKSARQNETFSGLYGDFLTVYFRTEDYIKKRKRTPRRNEWTVLNGKRFDVVYSQDELGISKLVLSAYRQPQLR